MNKKPVVITTEFKGVFFGYVADDSKLPSEVVLERARMAVYWSTETKGVVGLAANGPAAGSKVTAATPRATFYRVTSVLDCTPQSVERWEAGVWD